MSVFGIKTHLKLEVCLHPFPLNHNKLATEVVYTVNMIIIERKPSLLESPKFVKSSLMGNRREQNGRISASAALMFRFR